MYNHYQNIKRRSLLNPTLEIFTLNSSDEEDKFHGRRMMKEPGKAQVLGYLVLNVIFSLIIILLNKWIYTHVHFPNITLSMLHFIVTFFGLYVCEKCNVFNVKSVRLREITVLALSFCGFVVFTNLSLEYNTVGTFQVTKVLTTPGVMILQMMYYGKDFSVPVKLTTIPIIAGVVLNYYYDIKFSSLGIIFAFLGVLITSLYQVLVNKKQSELQMSSMQLLFYQAPLSTVFLIVLIPFVESPIETFTTSWSPLALIYIAVSCLAAFFCNLTTYWIIGNTSPLTYNMLGHSKFILVTTIGWYMFDAHVNTNQILGVLLTFLGIIAYTHLKLKENELARKESLLEEVKS